MSEAVLYSKCLGFTDLAALGMQRVTPNPRDPEAGATELIGCSNVTITDMGVEKIPATAVEFTHSAPITNISAGNRFVYQDGIDVKEWDGTNHSTIGAILSGPVIHTPIDCRINSGGVVYKSVGVGGVITAATVGANPNPTTSRPFYGMPAFKQGFTYNGRVYAVNETDDRFLEYSENYHYDLWNPADNFLNSITSVIDTGSIPGCIVTLHSNGVTVYSGDGISQVGKKFYPCSPYTNTLFSGLISKTAGYGHVFLCSNGVYLVDTTGALVNITEARFNKLGALNDSYKCAVVDDGKYLAFGNTLCIEYDFGSKAVMLRDSTAASATVWSDKAYYAVDDTVVFNETSGTVAASLTLPYSDLNKPGIKSLSNFYFTGIFEQDLIITATDQEGESWELTESGLGAGAAPVYNYRIVTPKGRLGNHISFNISSPAGAFRMEKLTAVLMATTRTR